MSWFSFRGAWAPVDVTAVRQGMAGTLDRYRFGGLAVLCAVARAAYKEALARKWTAPALICRGEGTLPCLQPGMTLAGRDRRGELYASAVAIASTFWLPPELPDDARGRPGISLAWKSGLLGATHWLDLSGIQTITGTVNPARGCAVVFPPTRKERPDPWQRSQRACVQLRSAC